MKLPLKITAPAASGTAGFILTVFIVKSLPQPQISPSAMEVSAISPDTGASAGAESGSGSGSRSGNGHLKLTGAALVGQFRTALTLMGIDPAWAESLAEEDVSGFPELLERMQYLPEGRRVRLRSLLLGRWAVLDPVGGAEFFKSREDDGSLEELFRQWQRLDFTAAAARAEEYGGNLLCATLCDKAVLDAPGLLAWFSNRPDLNPLTLFHAVFSDGPEVDALECLMKADPDRILAWARQLPEDQWGAGFTGGFAALLARRSPEEAIGWVKSLKNPAYAGEALAGVAESLAASQPERALALMAGLSPEESSDPLCDSVIAKMDMRDTDKIISLADALPKGEMRSRLMKATLSVLLEKDPAKAFALSDSLGPEAGGADNVSIPAVVKTPEGARKVLEAAGAAGASAYQETVVREALLGWMENGPNSFAEYLKGKMDSPLLSSMRENLQAGLAMRSLLTGGADPVLVELIGLPPETLVKIQTERDPSLAATALENVEDPAARIQLAGNIAALMNRTDAMAWAATLKNGAEQAAVWKSIATDWVKKDSLHASEWIGSLPEGQGRDGAVMAMTGQVSKTDPDLAWKWALSVTGAPLRQEALATVAKEWNRRDSGALRQALDEGNFTAAEREKLIAGLAAGSPEK